ncbi:MAG: hypothetical protein R3220_07085 [Balneolaceae bacterium]|nr:hypothetical protein [Balneolaceae bacterium]
MEIDKTIFKTVKYFLFIFCFCFTNIATAQLSIYSGVTAGRNYHTFTVDDQNGILQPGIGEENTYGIPLRLAKGSWSFQTGVFSNNLTRAFYFKTPDGTQYGSEDDYESSISTLKIPFILSKEFKLINRVSIAPKAGIVWLTDQTKSDSTEVLSGTINEPNFVVVERVSNVVNKSKFLAQAGVDLNIYPFKYFLLTAGVSYNYGLQRIENTDVTYRLDGEEMTETLVSRGSGLHFQVGLRIPLVIMHGGHQRVLFD